MIWLIMRFTGHYYIQGVGYAAIMDILKSVLTNPWLLLLLFGLKFAATCLTLGSGGSGGIFSPCLFMGATMGAFFGQMMAFLTPNAGVDPVAFSIAGMAAAVSASTGAILTGTVMLLEMTQDPNVVMPIMITSAIAYGFRKWLSPESIYTLKLIRRGHFVPEGLQSAMAEARQVKDITEKDFRTLDAEDPVTVSEQPTLVLKEGAVLGVLPPHVSGPAAGALVSESFLMVPGENSLDDLLREMDRVGARFALVTSAMEEEHPHHITGILTERELAACARKEARLR
jgi:CIC family chloride channel protein